MEQRKTRGWPKVVLAALGVIVLAVLAFRLLQESAVDRELEAFQVKYRALGYPVTLEELKQRHEVPEGEENAAPLILAALDRIDDSDVDYDFIPIMGEYVEYRPGEPLPVRVASESQYFLSINEEPISELRRLIREPYCNFPIDWDNFVGMDLGRLAQMRYLARIFALRAFLLGNDGEVYPAIEAIEDIFLLGDIEQREPMYISYLVGVAISGIGTASVQTLLESATLNDEQLLRLAEVVQWAKARHDPLHSLLAEYILAEHWLEIHRAVSTFEGTGNSLGPLINGVYTLAGLEAHDALAYLRSIDRSLELLELPLKEAIEAWSTEESPFFFSLFPAGMMRESGTFGANGAFMLFPRIQIQYNAILTALQVERYRLEEGALPDSLEDLVPEYLEEVPDDPYGDGPLRFRADGESYVVYSVGSNRVDDGGYDFEEDKGTRPRDDFAFVVRRPSGEAR